MIFVESPTLLATFVQTPNDYDPDEHRTVLVALHASVDGLVIFGAGFDASWFPNGSLAEARDLPVFIAHGETDEAVAIAESERARDTLTGLGYEVTFRPFSGGHMVPLDILTEVVSWMSGR